MPDIFSYLEKLRAKPEHHRKKIAMRTTIVMTLAIFLIWASVMLNRFISTPAIINTEQSANELSAFESIVEQFTNFPKSE